MLTILLRLSLKFWQNNFPSECWPCVLKLFVWGISCLVFALINTDKKEKNLTFYYFFYKLKSWRIVTKTSSHLKLNLVIIFFSKYITFCYKMKVSYFKATNKIKSFMKFYIYVIFYSKKIVNSGKIKKRKSKQRYFSQSCNLVFLVWTNFVEGFFWSEELKIMLKRSERLILVTFRDVFCSNKLLSSLTR
jgi:hypothetical protein